MGIKHSQLKPPPWRRFAAIFWNADHVVDPGTITLAMQADVASGTVGYRKSVGAGPPETQTLATLKTDLGLAAGGLADGDYGDITVSGSGAVMSVDAGAISLAMQANIATARIMGRTTAGTGVQEALTPAQAKTVLAIANTDVSGLGTLATQSGTFSGTSSGTNTGDQTSIVGITGTKAQFDTAVTDGNILYVGDAPTAHTHPQSDITSLVADLAAKAPSVHTHLLAAGATDVTITAANLNALDDGLTTALHFHDADRARGVHTGTQLAATISDLGALATLNQVDLAQIVNLAVGTGKIAANAVLNGKLAQMATATIKGRVTAGTGDPEDLTGTQATTLLDLATVALKGLAPARSGVATEYLNGAGAYTVPASGGGSGPTTAVAIVDFGAFPGASDASVAITGLASIVAGSRVSATIIATASVDHSADEHWAESIAVIAGNIVAATGFTIYAKNIGAGDTRLYGKFNVAYSWAA